MKRKNWRANSEHPSRVGPSFHPGSLGVLGSKTLFNDSEAQRNQGVGCNKRVRFRDLHNSKLQESASVPLERVQDTKSDEPKTSEYAFFKKLREETLHTLPLHHDKSQSINQKVSQRSSRGKIDVSHTQTVGGCLENVSPLSERSMGHKNLKTQLPKNATPDNLSPHTTTPDFASAFDMKRVCTTSLDVHNKQEKTEEGARCHNLDIFSRKRHKLHQLAAKTLSVEVDELFSNGNDIVSMLLSKLLPENSRNKSFEDLKTRTSEMDTQSESFTSQKFDIHINKCQWTPARNFLELEYGPPLDVGFSSCWSESRTQERPSPNVPKAVRKNFLKLEYCPPLDVGFSSCLSESRTQEHPSPTFPNCCSHGPPLDVGFSSCLSESRTQERPSPIFPGCYSHETILDKIMELDYERKPRLFTGDDMNLNINKHLCLTSTHQKDLDDFHYSIKPLNAQEPQTLLLGWDEDNMVDESIVSTVSKSKELILHPFLSGAHDDDLQNINNSYCANEFCYPIKNLHGEQTQNRLLGWDVDSRVDERNLSPVLQNRELSLNCFLSSHSDDQEKNLDDSCIESALCTESLVSYQPPNSENTELSLNCFLPILCGDKKNFDDSFTEARLSTESLISYLPPNLMPLQFSSSTSKKSHKKDDIAGNHFSSCLPEMINQLDMNESFACNGSSISLYPPNQLCSWRNILNARKHYPDEEAFSSGGFDFYTEPPCKPKSVSSRDHYWQAFHALECPQSENLSPYLIRDSNENCLLSHIGTNRHLSNDMIDIHNWSSNYFQSAFDKDKSYPLLLDKSHWHDYNGENLF